MLDGQYMNQPIHFFIISAGSRKVGIGIDMLKTFYLNKPFNLHLDLPPSDNPPLCRIMQYSKGPIITSDFYLTNMEPREWILPTPPTNNDVPTSNSAAAANNPPLEIPADPLQPGKI